MGLGGTESNGWQQWWFSLLAGFTPTGCLVAFLLSGCTHVYFSTITQSSNYGQKNITFTIGWFFPYHLNLKKFPIDMHTTETNVDDSTLKLYSHVILHCAKLEINPNHLNLIT